MRTLSHHVRERSNDARKLMRGTTKWVLAITDARNGGRMPSHRAIYTPAKRTIVKDVNVRALIKAPGPTNARGATYSPTRGTASRSPPNARPRVVTVDA